MPRVGRRSWSRMEERSRYALVSRRALLAGSLGLGVAAGCANRDDEVLAGASAAAGTIVSTTSVPPATSASTTTEAPLGFGNGAELVVSFTYERLPGGKALPPYMAVWVEDAAGALLETIELWFEQSGKGPRWLPDLRRWFSVDQERVAAGGADLVDVVSSATRLPGTTSVAWDGVVTGGGSPLDAAFICIEAARERGPYSLIRESIRIDGEAFDVSLPDDQELIDASVAYVA